MSLRDRDVTETTGLPNPDANVPTRGGAVPPHRDSIARPSQRPFARLPSDPAYPELAGTHVATLADGDLWNVHLRACERDDAPVVERCLHEVARRWRKAVRERHDVPVPILDQLDTSADSEPTDDVPDACEMRACTVAPVLRCALGYDTRWVCLHHAVRERGTIERTATLSETETPTQTTMTDTQTDTDRDADEQTTDTDAEYWGHPLRARRWHIFDGVRSLCGGWAMTNRTGEKSAFTGDESFRDGDDCKTCCRKAGVCDE